MASKIANKESFANVYCPRKCCVLSPYMSLVDSNSSSSNDYALDMNDQTTLMSSALSNKKQYCQCFFSNKSKLRVLQRSHRSTHPWITFVHILCTAALALFALYLASNVLIFEKISNGKEMDDGIWRLFPTEHDISTAPTTSSTTDLPLSTDKCEPLYVLVYVHCCVWFLFLILDHVARQIHHKTLRSRGHLRACARLGRLAAIPFQLVSLWTVLLAIFITIYAQQDGADMQPYCDANMLISPKNGIAVLLVIEFVFVTISSLMYANSVRKFSLEKPSPDVYGWGEKSYCDRWTPEVLKKMINETMINRQENSGESSNHEQRDKQCLLDLLEYYFHANQELAANLSRTSQKLRRLEEEKELQQPSQA